ncbi:putative PIG3 family NAD(P)H quinone oxidoreductase [Melghirimyces profundicolus]|uniref:Putative PIG3 family NAD(P)H quinone oxidoreductase n=1 Tax=Melghirimyces profundicolus TaxID=1242148 RepID=A0A2T6C7F8_9BACL|nr:NAD(P)H-quinone oxidoreductase [Melghirimyces profundicolus]PTX64247.1 putative PIG3 family NAD(P)H quinone oxidoreductase [Melghirimyces profundicolus]
MQAVIVTEPGGPENLKVGEYPTPRPTDHELLVRVKATALNRADILQRKGHYPPPKGASPILGLEMAGVVEKVGENCRGWKPGDRVFGLLPGGGYAEYAVIPGDMALPIPEGYGFEEAAAIAEVFLTAYQALFWLGSLKQGEKVLIHAGASGVGTAAIQLAKAAGATVYTTAGSSDKLEACRSLGADLAVNYKEGPFEPHVRSAAGENGVQLVLDFVGAPYWEQNLNCLGIDGKLVLISTLGGAQLENASLVPFLAKRLQVIGTTLRSRSLHYKIELTRDFADHVLPLFGEGKIKPVIDRTFSWKEVREAHRYMEENRNIGKVILRVD